MSNVDLILGVIGIVNALVIFFIGYIQKSNNERFDAEQKEIKELQQQNTAILLSIRELQLTKQDFPHIETMKMDLSNN